jgi:decaprenylphospho-beta-D-erythro-pentofuranosid-2-ulose 2-reductase
MNTYGAPERVALIGGTSEIGLAIIDAVTNWNAELRTALIGRTSTALAQAAASRPGCGGTFVYDAEQIGSVSSALRAADAALGGIDLVILASGVLPRERDASPDEIARAGAVNYSGALEAIDAAVAVLAANGGGHLCYISSIAAVRVRADMPAYSSAKQAVERYILAKSSTFSALGVSVHILRPGYVHTKMSAHVKPAPFSQQPAQVADALVRHLRKQTRLHDPRVHVLWSSVAVAGIGAVLRVLPRRLLGLLAK